MEESWVGCVLPAAHKGDSHHSAPLLCHSDAENKPRRSAILEKYAEEIEQLYAE